VIETEPNEDAHLIETEKEADDHLIYSKHSCGSCEAEHKLNMSPSLFWTRTQFSMH
jgi:hypothetical protein